LAIKVNFALQDHFSGGGTLVDNIIVVFAGSTDFAETGSHNAAHAAVEWLNIDSATEWVQGAPLPEGATFPGVAAIPNSNEVLIVGGRDKVSRFSQALIYDIQTNSSEILSTYIVHWYT